MVTMMMVMMVMMVTMVTMVMIQSGRAPTSELVSDEGPTLGYMNEGFSEQSGFPFILSDSLREAH